MLLVMYWDDERKEKAKLEGKLRKKRDERKGIKVEEDTPSDIEALSLADFARQTELINQQQEELKDIKSIMLEQGELLREMLQKQAQPVIVSNHTEVTEKTKIDGTETKMTLPKLAQDVDSDIIDKTGIETGGGNVGREEIRTESISDKIRKLRELKKTKGE